MSSGTNRKQVLVGTVQGTHSNAKDNGCRGSGEAVNNNLWEGNVHKAAEKGLPMPRSLETSGGS